MVREMYDVLSEITINNIRSVTNIYSEKGANASRMNRAHWAIILKYEGETEYISCGKRYISNMDNPVILPMGCSYTWKCIKPGHFYTMEFESSLSCSGVLSFSVKDGKRLLSIFKEIEYKMLLKQNFCKPECMAAAYTIIAHLEKSLVKKYVPGNKQNKLSAAIEYIVKNYNTKITNDFLASLAGCSTVYFRKLFYEVCGTSPIKYITDLRISKAKEMLSSDYSSIGNIALTLGYSNIYDFSRAFKAYTGVSPTEYARK